MDFTFKSFAKEASLGFSLASGSFTHFWYFQVPELFKVSFFTILPTDDQLIPVCLVNPCFLL